MEHFLLSFYIIFPIFFYILAGFCIRRRGLMDTASFTKLNQTIFKIFIPLMLFINIYQADFTSALNPRLFILCCGLILAIFLLHCWLVPKFVSKRSDIPVIVQGIYRSNYVLFGLTIASSVHPNQDIGVISSLAAVTVPLFNVLSVILFESFRGQKLNLSRLLKGIVTNPLIIASVLGILFSLLQIRIPVFLENTISDAAGLASPVALICLGGMLSFSSIRHHLSKLTAVLLGRLVVVPIIALIIFILLGYRNVELTAVMALFASPTAVSSAPMAYAMDGNGELAGEVVATTSVFCIITLFFFIWFLKLHGFIA